MILQGHPLGQSQLRGARRKFAEGGAAARGVQHPSGLGAAFADGNAPLRRRGGDQHGAGRGTGFAHGQPLVGDARRTAGTEQSGYLTKQLAHEVSGRALHHSVILRLEGQRIDQGCLIVVDGIQSRLLELYSSPIRVHFIGQQHRKSGMSTLAHLGLRHDDRHGVVGGHLDPTIQHRLPGQGGQGCTRIQSAPLGHRRPTDHEGTCRADAAEDEMTSLQIGHGSNPQTVVCRGIAMPCQKASKPAAQ